MMSPTAIHPLKIVAAVGAAFLVWGLVLAYASSPAWANDITVTSPDDVVGNDGVCTLREAITSANNDPPSEPAAGECANGSGDDIIKFALQGTAPWTVNLTEALPDLSTNIDLEGPGADQLTVRRSDTAETNFGIFTVVGGSSAGQQVVVSISAITSANGNDASGGGIFIAGPTPAVPAPQLTINSSTISGNSASFNGGGIFNQGTLTVNDSTISGNSATNGFGGGIDNLGTLTVSDSTFSGNSADRGGGGIDNLGTLTVNNSTFSGNSSNTSNPSTITFGGGIDNQGTLEVSNSTFSGNSSDVDGGISNAADATLTLKNTIVANSTGGDCSGAEPTTDSGYNLVEDGSCGVSQANNSLSGDPMLGSLADNGGPTKTHALLAGSPAIDKGNSDLTKDQRGLPRPFDDPGIAPAQGGNNSDIGAFEAQEVLNTAPTATVTNGQCTINTARGTINLTLNDPDGDALTLTFLSNSNTTLVPNNNIAIGGSGNNRTISVTAAPKKSGTATLTFNLSDGTATVPVVITVKVGSDKNETLTGTSGTDMLFGLGGKNTINGNDGNDLLCGGNSIDTISGGGGNDIIDGANGNDLLSGGTGDDKLRGSAGDDRLTGDAGADSFSGGTGTDTASDLTASQGDTQDGTIP